MQDDFDEYDEGSYEDESVFNQNQNPPANLNNLEVTNLKKKGEEKKVQGKKCCVCLEEMKVGEEIVRLKCGHHFHKKCILPWLKKNNSCPICRVRAT